MREVSSELREQLRTITSNPLNPPTCKVVLVQEVEGYPDNEITIPQIRDVNVFTDESNFSNSCNFNIANVNPDNFKDYGYFNHHRNDPGRGKPTNFWSGLIVPNARIRVYMGYGTELVRTFDGFIDTITMRVEPSDSILEVNCRDKAKLLMDQACNSTDDGVKQWYIMYPLDEYITPVYLDHTNQDPYLEEVVIDICRRAGFSIYDIEVEETGIRLSDTTEGILEFEDINWDAAINRIRDLSAFDFWVDEEGKAKFKRPQTKDITYVDEEVMMFGIPPEPQSLSKRTIVESSLVVKDWANEELIYQRGIDYEYDPIENTIIRLVGGSIPIDQWVNVYYTYVAWRFINGLNIKMLPLTFSHDNVYAKLRVAGDGGIGGGIEATVNVSSNFEMWDGSKLPEDKLLTIVNEELLDEAQCLAFAEKLMYDMKTRYITVDFEVIPLPHLQLYDVIQIIVYGTILEGYLITGQTLSYKADTQELTQTINGHHFVYAAP